MKKMKFILPRIIGLTLVAGVATLLLSIVFKALLLASAVAIIVTLVGRARSRRAQMMQPGGMQRRQRFAQLQSGPGNYYGRSPFQNNNVMPAYAAQGSSPIIPIN